MTPEKLFLTHIKAGLKSSATMIVYERKDEEDVEYIRKDLVAAAMKKKLKAIKAILRDGEFSIDIEENGTDMPRIQRGPNAGRINIKARLREMSVGDTVKFDVNCVTVASVRNACSTLGNKIPGRKYKATAPGVDEPFILVKRIR